MCPRGRGRAGGGLAPLVRRAPLERGDGLARRSSALDWNDTYLSLEPAHLSDNLGAVLATDSSGEEVLVATALAYERQCRLCDAASLRIEGFDHLNHGLVSATLAAGRLFGLDAGELREAVNVAVDGHVALRQARTGELTEWDGFALANVSRVAVVAGVHGPAPVFGGEYGFSEQVAGPFDLDVDAFGGNGGAFKLTETLVKYYPQAALDSVFDRFGLERLTEEKVHGEDVRELMDGVEITEDPAFTETYGEAFPDALTVETATDSYERYVEYPKGHPENPLSRAKFERAAAGRLPDGRVDDVIAWVEGTETEPDLPGLFERCTLS